MRTILTSARIAVVSLLLATGMLTPLAMTTRAAASASFAHDPAITGTVVATPQQQVPATLLIQVGSQTLAVSITGQTELSRRFGGDSNLGEFADGDTVDVIGSPNESGGITASQIINQSVQERYTELHGTVASINPPAAVPTTIVLTGLSTGGNPNAPYPNPLPAQISLPVSAGTTITVDGVSQPASLAIGKVMVNDNVITVGVFDRFKNSFDSIEAITVVTAPPVTLDVKGLLAAAPSQLVAPATLCVKNASVSAATIRPAISLTSPCQPGQLPVYVTSTTKLTRLYGEGSSLVEFSTDDTVWVTARLINTQLIALTVQDRSIHLPTITGTVQSITANGNLTNVVVTVASYTGGSPSIPIGSQVVLPLTNSSSPNCVTPSPVLFPCTIVTTGAGTTNGYMSSELAVGESLTGTGIWNTHLLRFLDTTKVVAAALPPPPSLTIKGTLTATPSQISPPVLLCLRNTVVTSSPIKPFVGVVSPCSPGQIPVAVTTATRIMRANVAITNLRLLLGGDSLQVTGSLINNVFTATLIRDLTNHVVFTTVVGTVGYVSPFTHPAYFTLRVTGGLGRHVSIRHGATIVVYVSPSTKFTIGAVTTNAVTVLNPGQRVLVVGVYSSKYHDFTYADRVQVL
jgi:Domain of unknown function (DUF5666)